MRTWKNASVDPVRLIEWKEDQSRQRFDKGKIAGKIGHE